ncbi:alpha/beta hydrolase, partial [bacterium]|nr:alpha/beta hydrolase [bacterium]
DGRYLDNSTEAFFAVSCTDMPYEGTVDDVRQLAKEWEQQAPTFGRALAWGLLTCSNWPRQSERFDAVRAEGSAPILVVSTTSDPATPYQWGVGLAETLDNAGLVTWKANNHTAYREGSGCVDEAVDGYLLTGELPPSDLRCD